MANRRRAPAPPVAKTSRTRSPFLFVLALGALSVATLVFSAVWLFDRGSDSTAPPVTRLAELTTPDFHSLAISPSDANFVLFGHHGGVLVSRDGGRRWEPSSLAGPNDDAMGIGYSSANPDTVFAAGHNTFFRSDDKGRTWTIVRAGLPRADVHGLTVVPGSPTRILANVAGLGLYRSDDAGLTWSRQSEVGFPLDAIQVAAANSDLIFAASPEQGVLRSADGGKTFAATSNLPATALTVAAAAAPETVYAGTDRGLYRSTDQGRTWVLRGVPSGPQVLAVAVNPQNADDLVLVSVDEDGVGAVYRSFDGGASWTKK